MKDRTTFNSCPIVSTLKQIALEYCKKKTTSELRYIYVIEKWVIWSEMEADNGLPLIGINVAVQCLLEHGGVKGNRISPRPLKRRSIKSRRGASRGGSWQNACTTDNQ